MAASQDPTVLAYRLERLRNAPKRWLYWIAAITVANGVLVFFDRDFLLLAGFVAPYSLAGAEPHVLTALVVIALAHYAGSRGVQVAYAMYAADLLWAGYLEAWEGVVMHVVIFALLGIVLFSKEAVALQLRAAELGVSVRQAIDHRSP